MPSPEIVRESNRHDNPERLSAQTPRKPSASHLKTEEPYRSRVMVLERGDLFFLYRPDVEELTPEGLLDVRRFYMVHHPQGRDLFRLIAIGKKKLPEPGNGGQRHWSFVDGVFATPEELRGAAAGISGSMTPREDILPAGEGVYALVLHGNHTHLLYALELPEKPVQGSGSKRIVRPFTRMP